MCLYIGFCGLFIAYNGVAHSDYMRPFYYQMGTTAASVVLSIVEALLILAGINLLELQQAKCADPEIDHQEKEVGINACYKPVITRLQQLAKHLNYNLYNYKIFLPQILSSHVL